ncbi:MAG TPA: transglutaminase domain-containing protein, partial [Chitinophagaceae bacterium]|nr:transglutaminase domain-containing protein [Chitinophagaceae bacterium]
QETILNGFGGDCDDHSILMASAMGSIGARSRIILIKGHAYPELFIGDKKAFDHFKQAVVQLFQAYTIKNIFYHAHDNEYWINLDYTEHYPGGRYMNGEVYAVIE